jgi:hypothetical protein
MPQKKKPAPGSAFGQRASFEQFTIHLTDPNEVQQILPLLKAEMLDPSPGPKIDVLKVRWPGEAQITRQKPDGIATATVLQKAEIESPVPVTFYPHENGVACFLNGQAIQFKRPTEDTERTRQRNAALNIKIPSFKIPSELTATELARAMSISRQAMQKRIKRLIADGWINPANLPERNRKRHFDLETVEIIKANPKQKKQVVT